jgi:chemotaxis protein MotB
VSQPSNHNKKEHGPADLLSLGGNNHHAAEDGGEGNWLVSYADMMTLLVGFFVILLSFSTVDAEKFDEAKRAITEQFGGTYQIPYSELAERINEAIKKLGVGDQLFLKTDESGLEISFKGTVFFDTGSASLKEEAEPVLKSLIEAIKSDSDPLDITIEGHTDNVPIVHGKIFRNNWELSSLRACRVLESFLDEGLPKSRLTAVGYADARPLVPNEDASGTAIPDNQAQNRRVIIRLVRHSEPVMMKREESSHESVTE